MGRGGSITATVTAGGSAGDILEISGQGFGLNQVGLSSNFVLFGTNAGPVVVGSFSGGTGGVPLVISLNTSATTSSIQAVLRSLSFRTQGDTPSTATRTVSIQVSDSALPGNLATRDVTVISINDAPVISFAGAAVTYTENAAALLVVPTATVADVDSTDFAGGSLTITLTAGGAARTS